MDHQSQDCIHLGVADKASRSFATTQQLLVIWLDFQFVSNSL